MSEQYVHATVTPDTMLAGDSTEFVLSLTIGSEYVSGPSRIIFDFPGTVGMSRPTQSHQEEHGYIDAYVSNPEVAYRLHVWDMESGDFVGRGKGGWRGMAARQAVLDLDGRLAPGDTVELHWGDAGRGYGPGAQVTQVVPRKDYACTIHVRCFDSQEAGLPDYGRDFEGYERPEPLCEVPLTFKVLPREAHRLRVLRRHAKTVVIPHDVFWNIADVQATEVLDASEPGRVNREGVIEFANKNVHVTSRGLPLNEAPPMEDVYDGYNIYWGDIHTHSAFSIDSAEREKMDMQPGDLMRFARHRAFLDFYATTDHHQPQDALRLHLGFKRWEEILESVRAHHAPGQFVVFPGFEYRCKRGDTVVLCNWLPAYDEIAQGGWTDVRRLWEAWQDRDFLTIPHFHNPGALADGEWWRPESAAIEPVLEIFSCHGSYEREDALENHIPLMKPSRPDRYGAHFLREGMKYGLVCNSDGHKGHVGSNGLTAVYAKSLDRDAILEAYRNRRVYGTTNARIRLLFTANGALMGSVLPAERDKVFRIDATGETRLKKVELFRTGALYKRYAPAGNAFSQELTVCEDGPSNWYVRVTQTDNQQAFSSPIWFE